MQLVEDEFRKIVACLCVTRRMSVTEGKQSVSAVHRWNISHATQVVAT